MEPWGTFIWTAIWDVDRGRSCIVVRLLYGKPSSFGMSIWDAYLERPLGMWISISDTDILFFLAILVNFSHFLGRVRIL